MKKITTSSLIVVLVIGFIAYALVYFIFDKPKLDTRPNFTVKLPIKKEQMKIPPQECTRFLNVNPHACDKG